MKNFSVKSMVVMMTLLLSFLVPAAQSQAQQIPSDATIEQIRAEVEAAIAAAEAAEKARADAAVAMVFTLMQVRCNDINDYIAALGTAYSDTVAAHGVVPGSFVLPDIPPVDCSLTQPGG